MINQYGGKLKDAMGRLETAITCLESAQNSEGCAANGFVDECLGEVAQALMCISSGNLRFKVSDHIAL